MSDSPSTSFAIKSESNDSQERESLSRMKILDGKFFKILEEKSSKSKNSIVALCVACQPKHVEIRGNTTTSSNFRSHLKRRHDDIFKDYLRYTVQRQIEAHSRSETVTRQRQPAVSSKESTQIVPQPIETFEEDVAKFIVHSMVPIKVVDDPYFQFIFFKFGIQSPSRRSVGMYIADVFRKNITSISNELTDVAYICTTANVWSIKKKSIFGVTAHWITYEFGTIKRKSAALACRRFNSLDSVEDILHEIHSEFGLNSNKVVATVTDDGSNNAKAFRMFGVKLDCFKDPNDIDIYYDSDNEDSDEEESEDETPNYDDLFSESMETGTLMPLHLRCCAHALIFCATNDAMKTILASEELKTVHSHVVLKCTALWKAASRPKTAEIIQNVLGYTLSRPGEARWTTLYGSLGQIISIKEKIGALFKVLNIKYGMFKDNEFQYIEEHLASVKPLSEAIDILQGEENTFYGYLVPCLLALRRKLRNLEQAEWRYCKPLIATLCKSIETRFSEFFNFSKPEAENAAVAAFSHPKFKNRWLSCVETMYHDRLLNLFKNAIVAEIPVTQIPVAEEQVKNSDKFFDFDTPTVAVTKNPSSSRAEMQVLRYFDEASQELSILESYPEIRKVFIKFNTPLPSSAPVERLFPYTTMTDLLESHRLTDTMFEKKVLLKANLIN